MKIVWFNDRAAPGMLLSGMLAGFADIELIITDDMEAVPDLCAERLPDLVVIDTPALYELEPGYTGHLKHGSPHTKICIVLEVKAGIPAKKDALSAADIAISNNASPEELLLLYRYSKKHYRIIPKFSSGGRKDDSWL